MESFNENLGNFLTGCRDNALEELRTDKRYTERKAAQASLRTKLEAVISAEAKELFEEYAVSAITLNGMEFNRMILLGLSLPAELQKCFNASTPEYMAFADEYLN